MYNMDSIQPQNHGLSLTTIEPLKLPLKLLMLIFTETVYYEWYNKLISQN